jgi:hypothetical protein
MGEQGTSTGIKARYEKSSHLFGLVVYERLGEVANIRVLGFAVWERVGNRCAVLGFNYTRREHGNDNG